jgi:hypothetical protein
MRFVEINLLGVYVAPMSVMMVTAWVVIIGLRGSAAHFGLLRHVWHRPCSFLRFTRSCSPRSCSQSRGEVAMVDAVNCEPGIEPFADLLDVGYEPSCSSSSRTVSAIEPCTVTMTGCSSAPGSSSVSNWLGNSEGGM